MVSFGAFCAALLQSLRDVLICSLLNFRKTSVCRVDLYVGEQDYLRVAVDFQPHVSLSQVYKSTNILYYSSFERWLSQRGTGTAF